MPRYIDADALKAYVARMSGNGDYVESVWCDIDHAPTADVVEVKHGTWIHDGYDFLHGNDWIHCSVCGKKGINVPADLTNFCPNCGADMKGGD